MRHGRVPSAGVKYPRRCLHADPFFRPNHLDDRSISRLYDFLRRAQREHVISLGRVFREKEFCGHFKHLMRDEFLMQLVHAWTIGERKASNLNPFKSALSPKAPRQDSRNEVIELDRPAVPHQRRTIFLGYHLLECRTDDHSRRLQKLNYC